MASIPDTLVSEYTLTPGQFWDFLVWDFVGDLIARPILELVLEEQANEIQFERFQVSITTFIHSTLTKYQAMQSSKIKEPVVELRPIVQLQNFIEERVGMLRLPRSATHAYTTWVCLCMDSLVVRLLLRLPLLLSLLLIMFRTLGWTRMSQPCWGCVILGLSQTALTLTCPFVLYDSVLCVVCSRPCVLGVYKEWSLETQTLHRLSIYLLALHSIRVSYSQRLYRIDCYTAVS